MGWGSLFILSCEICWNSGRLVCAISTPTQYLNLFRHLFWLKKKGGGGSKVVGGVYLQLRDGMASEYINVLLNTSLKGWNTRWFYIKQSYPII